MAINRELPSIALVKIEDWFGQPVYPNRSSAAAALVIGLIATIGPLWKLSRYLGTYAHEIGHATVGALIGANLDDVRVHGDSSGLAVYRIPASWGRLRHCLVSAAGYPAPGVVGCATVTAASAGYGRAWLAYMTVVIATVVLLQVRNLWGIVSGIAIVAAGYGLTRVPFNDVVVSATIAIGVALNVAAIRQARTLGRSLAHVADSDAHQLRRWGWLPARFWSLAFLVTALATAWLTWDRLSPSLGVAGVPSIIDLEELIDEISTWIESRAGM